MTFKVSFVGKIANFPKRKKKKGGRAFGKIMNFPGKRR